MNRIGYSPQKGSGVYHNGLVQSNHKQIVDREEQLEQLFAGFQQDFTFEELILFLDRCNKVEYDRGIAEQLFAECEQLNQRIQAKDFIKQFVDTERNLQFRISFNQSEIDELVRQKNELIHEVNQQGASMNKVTLSIYSASNLEPSERGQSINEAFVSVRDDNDNQLVTTGILPNNLNPVWNDIFTLDLAPNQSNLVLVVKARSRFQQSEFEIGRTYINLAELQQLKKISKKDLHLMKGNCRTPSVLSFDANFVFSEVSQTQEKIRAKEEEIRQAIEKMRPNQVLLAKLIEIFSENKNGGGFQQNNYAQGQRSGFEKSNPNYYQQNLNSNTNYNNNLRHSVNVMNLSAYYFPHIKEQKFEQKALEQLESISENLVDDWAKLTVIFLLATMVLCVFQCFYKPNFLELTLLLIFLCLCFSGILTQTQHRFISVFLFISWVSDLIWLIFLASNWFQVMSSADDDDGLKKFSVVISTISIFCAKLPLVICMWREYFQFDRFKDYITLRLKNRSLQLNELPFLTGSSNGTKLPEYSQANGTSNPINNPYQTSQNEPQNNFNTFNKNPSFNVAATPQFNNNNINPYTSNPLQNIQNATQYATPANNPYIAQPQTYQNQLKFQNQAAPVQQIAPIQYVPVAVNQVNANYPQSLNQNVATNQVYQTFGQPVRFNNQFGGQISQGYHYS